MPSRWAVLPPQQQDELFDPYRTALLNLGWDLTGDGFGQRQMVYEIYHAGDPMRIAARHHQEY
ncbi:4-hydroxyphenylacetate 3-monooxygenase, partial [Pseudomonas syringae pv. actinidiae]|nr:4-hydroxyphenylacetate 3-monooxygenase [Pseudomonas syringae pv. actinidiae]